MEREPNISNFFKEDKNPKHQLQSSQEKGFNDATFLTLECDENIPDTKIQ